MPLPPTATRDRMPQLLKEVNDSIVDTHDSLWHATAHVVMGRGFFENQPGRPASESKDAAVRQHEGDLVSREAVWSVGSGGRLGRGRLPSFLSPPTSHRRARCRARSDLPSSRWVPSEALLDLVAHAHKNASHEAQPRSSRRPLGPSALGGTAQAAERVSGRESGDGPCTSGPGQP